jgi:hypothetical protein
VWTRDRIRARCRCGDGAGRGAPCAPDVATAPGLFCSLVPFRETRLTSTGPGVHNNAIHLIRLNYVTVLFFCYLYGDSGILKRDYTSRLGQQ